MHRAFVGFVTAVATLMLAPPLVSAQAAPCANPAALTVPASGVGVEQICYNGSPAQQISPIDLTDPSGREDPAATVRLHETLAVKSSLLVPPATYLDLISSAARIRARYGTRTTIVQAIENGEELAIDGSGGAAFVVQHALQFFRVDVGRFIAAVHGTVFDISLDDPASVTFAVTDGTVSVTRLVSIRLQDENRTVDQIRVTEYLTAGARATATYARGAELWQTFQNTSAAQARFNHDLQNAQAENDVLLEQDAQWNLGRLSGAVTGRAPHGANAAEAIGVAGVAAAAAGAFTSHPSQSAPQPTQPTEPGTVTVSGKPPATPTPSPTPASQPRKK